MEVQLTSDQQAFVRQAIESGRLRREEDAVKEAPALWEERERTRVAILAAVDDAEASLARGDADIVRNREDGVLLGSSPPRIRFAVAKAEVRQAVGD
jgi:Arc/MetJ-type ribon-helix-helix transcriptional regulator